MDRERRAQYVLEAAASDRGSPTRNTTAQVVIDITDVNDHEPMFNQTEYTASVSEEIQVRTERRRRRRGSKYSATNEYRLKKRRVKNAE